MPDHDKKKSKRAGGAKNDADTVISMFNFFPMMSS